MVINNNSNLHFSLTCHLHSRSLLSLQTLKMSAPESSKRTEPLPGIEYVTPVSPVINLAGKLKLLFTREEIDDLNKPKVSISGGGIGGLTLALLLHKANIPFLVLERAKEIKALGKQSFDMFSFYRLQAKI